MINGLITAGTGSAANTREAGRTDDEGGRGRGGRGRRGREDGADDGGGLTVDDGAAACDPTGTVAVVAGTLTAAGGADDVGDLSADWPPGEQAAKTTRARTTTSGAAAAWRRRVLVARGTLVSGRRSVARGDRVSRGGGDVRRTQSCGASRAVSMTWPRTCTVIAPNHSTKSALWRNSSEWRSECGAISSPMPLARRTTVRMTTAGPRSRNRAGGGPLRR